MPLKRLDLLTSILSIITVVTLFVTLIIDNREYKGIIIKIDNYKELIRSHISSPTSEASKTEERKKLLESFFIGKTEPAKLADKTKEMLLKSGLAISSYLIEEDRIRFNFSGDRKNLEQFIKETRSNPDYIHYPIFSVKIDRNTSVSGYFTIKERRENEAPEKTRIIDSYRSLDIKRPYKDRVMNFSEKDSPILPVTRELTPETDSIETGKFKFIGTIRSGDSVTSLFREKDLGRIYRFKNGESVSGWTYLGEANGIHNFRNEQGVRN